MAVRRWHFIASLVSGAFMASVAMSLGDGGVAVSDIVVGFFGGGLLALTVCGLYMSEGIAVALWIMPAVLLCMMLVAAFFYMIYDFFKSRELSLLSFMILACVYAVWCMVGTSAASVVLSSMF